ncbi:MAG: hypothetical protein KF855_17250 [Acidobacteria bacterium]|nr:hypothetical protein [Acidobacteriota bacterium]
MDERRTSILKAFGLFVVVLALLSVVTDSIARYNENVREEQEKILREEQNKLIRESGEITFGVYGDYGDDRPWMRLTVVLLSFLSFLVLWKSSRLLFSTILTGLSFLIYILWAFRAANSFILDWNLYSNHPVGVLLLSAADTIDYAVFTAVTVLFFWQAFALCCSYFFGAPNVKRFP